eukprot:TRINITY_DN8006_c0_g1_i1.p1 TRINITY_DN8006_c0_g1~~TRINITY_DN8006_c0_g1_i1.p1  ORF type:complete len:620 (+),score=124.10 TRINITY_DN8006_c0_g1_i1:36-1895(+)
MWKKEMMLKTLLLLVVLAVAPLHAYVNIAMDTALLQLENKYENAEIWLYGASSECYKCELSFLLYSASSNATNLTEYIEVNTNFPYVFNISIVDLNVLDASTNSSVQMSYHFGQHGIYTLVAEGNNYEFITKVEPDNAYLPLIVAACILAAAAILYPIALNIFRRAIRAQRSKNPLAGENNHFVDNEGAFAPAITGDSASNKSGGGKKKSRVASLDVFRGICITIMIFVNYGGGGYWFFNHSVWNGLTVADLVFPWFIFIMGVAMPLSFNAMFKRGETKVSVLRRVVRRSVILFALGLFINNGHEILTWRIPGVLQRFAVAYLVTALILLFVPTVGARFSRVKKINEPIDPQISETDQLLSTRITVFKSSFFPHVLQWGVALLLLTTWLLITFLLPVPGCPTGYLGPGGLGDGGVFYNCTGGAARYVDVSVFGEKLIFQSPTSQQFYNTGSYDPEGILGNLTSIFLCFLGTQLGRILQVHSSPFSRAKRFAGWGIAFGALGTLLCLGRQNAGWIPINKNLWSASFVFVMGGTGFLVFTLVYFLVDVWRVYNGAPFIYVGMNPILIYCGHETLGYLFPFSFETQWTYTSHSLTLASNLLGTSCWLLIAFMMYRNNFFVNI